jgi:ATP phosphoribosyltransferase
MTPPLRIGLPKGRVLDSARALFERAGVDLSGVDTDDRRLVHPITIEGIGPAEVLILRASDVAAYVEGGVCALGVAGYDTIVEQGPDVLIPLDLGFGRCRMCVAARTEVDPFALETPRVATKYARIATEHFLDRGTPARVVQLSGAVEIAPLVGLADCIVDIVETGRTLEKNGLEVKTTLFEISSRLVVNRAALRLRMGAMRALMDRLEEAVA